MKKPAYTLKLTDEEIQALAFCADRGYFPVETYDALALVDGEPEKVPAGAERLWGMAEHEAWPISDLIEEDPNAFGACMSPELLGKVIDLWEEIV